MDIRMNYNEIDFRTQSEDEQHQKTDIAMLRRPPEKPHVINWA